MLQEDGTTELWYPTVTKLLDTLNLTYHVNGKDFLPDGTPLVA